MYSIKGLLVAAMVALMSVSAHAGKTNIVDTAVKAGTFRTLVTAVKAAGFVATLKGDGPFTVFAPTDEAFAKLPAGTVDDLLKPENKLRLADLLKYHMVSGKMMSGDIAGKTTEAKTVQGQSLAVDATKGVMIEGAKVVTADVETSNGVIHISEKGLLPKS